MGKYCVYLSVGVLFLLFSLLQSGEIRRPPSLVRVVGGGGGGLALMVIAGARVVHNCTKKKDIQL